MSASKITLTTDQQYVFDQCKTWLTQTDAPIFIITGSAGVGKTALTRVIAQYISRSSQNVICAVAPTHKARRVLSLHLNPPNSFAHISVVTIAALLKKAREHSYIGTRKFSSGDSSQMNKYTHFILDELSMISNKDLDILIAAIKRNDQKLIAIGDSCQIPSPSQGMIKKGEFLERIDNKLFDVTLHEYPLLNLSQIVRQSADSPIIKLATWMRDHMNDTYSIHDLINATIQDEHANVIINNEQFPEIYKKFKTRAPRIITYTNSQVTNYNKMVRKICEYDQPFHVGELLTGYANVGWPEPIIENGRDYNITKVVETEDYIISKFSKLKGHIINIVAADDPTKISNSLFFININDNNDFMQELARRAEIVNKLNSTKNDFKSYCELKNKTIFCQDVYKYGHKIYDETDFKKYHPLLFTRTSDLFNTQLVKIPSELYNLVNHDYKPILDARAQDSQKPLGDSEYLADQFKIIEKDITYGYAMTAHKSQGSTINTVIVDGMDFEKLTKNRWNHKFQLFENRVKEQNQLRYVAFTRASQNLFIVMQ